MDYSNIALFCILEDGRLSLTGQIDNVYLYSTVKKQRDCLKCVHIAELRLYLDSSVSTSMLTLSATVLCTVQ